MGRRLENQPQRSRKPAKWLESLLQPCGTVSKCLESLLQCCGRFSKLFESLLQGGGKPPKQWVGLPHRYGAFSNGLAGFP